MSIDFHAKKSKTPFPRVGAFHLRFFIYPDTSMPKVLKCRYCAMSFPASAERCPHCARPGLFPNVSASRSEKTALLERYKSVCSDAKKISNQKAIQDFAAFVQTSFAVIARPLLEVDRLASSSNEIYATYYRLIDGGVKLPSGSKWDVYRTMTDDAIFPGYRDHIRFAALSVGTAYPVNYGECMLVLKDNFIAHRASVFEENTVLWMMRRKIEVAGANDLPSGYRATWRDRVKLAVAKHGKQLLSGSQSDFSKLLLRSGKTGEDDDFIEVHIWGSLTIHSFEKVVYAPKAIKRSAQRIIAQALKEKLQKQGVAFEV